ncbi:hypothetical protein RSSM_06162 [Rhodopirellula sallentina SM41]|uniref:Uncharacterized protein n=1 Tax=Rhodopirellula sallentina SM41 TaxID=1263870 RepID=M5TTG4_9BACT|nr:hypothetical protein RSSM_06162 [Rhodopirellula sallentina SM41]
MATLTMMQYHISAAASASKVVRMHGLLLNVQPIENMLRLTCPILVAGSARIQDPKVRRHRLGRS